MTYITDLTIYDAAALIQANYQKITANTREVGVAYVAISGCVGVGFVYGSTSNGGVAAKCVSTNEAGVAYVPISTSEAGMASVTCCTREVGVAFVYGSTSKGGVTSMCVSTSEVGVASVCVGTSEVGVASVTVSGSEVVGKGVVSFSSELMFRSRTLELRKVFCFCLPCLSTKSSSTCKQAHQLTLLLA